MGNPMVVKEYHAVKALIMKNEKILLVRPRSFVGGEWEIPGGRKKEGESDEAALKREVREEVRIEVEMGDLLNEWECEIPDRKMMLRGKTFLCKPIGGRISLKDPEKQHTGYRWVDMDEARGLEIPGWLREALEKIKPKFG